MADNLNCDFLILGSGAAGLYAALQAAALGQVIMVTHDTLASGSSYRAQGGIAAVTTAQDSLAAHIEDTLIAGRGQCNTEVVNTLVREGSEIVRELIADHMPFDCTPDGEPHRGLEGGHSHHRVLHAQGARTGKALVEFLGHQVRQCPAITLIEHATAHRLYTDAHGHCIGAGVFLPIRKHNLVIHAPSTLLATGGYAALFERTTNPPGNIGTGLGLAAAAGAPLSDLEFMQFHPTALHNPGHPPFLITEALRGAGATLINDAGERFLADTPGAELAPRDTVAAAIHTQIANQDSPFVGLDLRHLAPDMLAHEFGAIMDHLAGQGIDVKRQPVPVAPAAHYSIGGVTTDGNGATAIPGLYAAGEVAATGVHGANRLASNSLLECLVFSRRAVRHAADFRPGLADKNQPVTRLSIDPARADTCTHRRQALGRVLTRNVGIERHHEGLTAAVHALDAARREAPWPDPASEYHAFHDHHMHQLAIRIAQAARRRTESVGVHCRTDSAPAPIVRQPANCPATTAPETP